MCKSVSLKLNILMFCI